MQKTYTYLLIARLCIITITNKLGYQHLKTWSFQLDELESWKIKKYYSIEELTGKSVVFVSNLKPRPLRGITSEGMMLAADDGEDNVKLITVDGEINTGSRVR